MITTEKIHDQPPEGGDADPRGSAVAARSEESHSDC